MLTVVTGGSGSGKSELAEKIAMSGGTSRLYIATMDPFGAEAFERIKRHREMRAEKAFRTIEKYTDLHETDVENDSSVLLECMSNLVANEIFTNKCTGEKLKEKILLGVEKIRTKSASLVIVTNEIFSDGISYDATTVGYIRSLGEINRMLVDLADNVIECVYGIPVVLKGGLPQCVC